MKHIAVPAQKNLGGNEVLPKFCDVYLNHDFIVHFGYDKKIVWDSQTKNQFCPKIMVIFKKKKGPHLKSISDFSLKTSDVGKNKKKRSFT